VTTVLTVIAWAAFAVGALVIVAFLLRR